MRQFGFRAWLATELVLYWHLVKGNLIVAEIATFSYLSYLLAS